MLKLKRGAARHDQPKGSAAATAHKQIFGSNFSRLRHFRRGRVAHRAVTCCDLLLYSEVVLVFLRQLRIGGVKLKGVFECLASEYTPVSFEGS